MADLTERHRILITTQGECALTDHKHTSEIRVGQWAAAAVLSIIATQASAADCYLRADLIKELATKYGEVQVARAMEARGGMVEIYAAPSGSWTMVVIPPDIGETP